MTMFCHKCGTQLAEEAVFCQKCGTKVEYTDAVQQTSMVSQENLDSDNINVLKNTESLLDSVKMVISIDNVVGRAYSTFTFSVFLDGIKLGDFVNGQTTAYRISPGKHLIKIGAFVIGIDVPKGDTSVELDFHWGENIKPEIVCHQSQWVSMPCEKEKVSFKAVFESINMGIKVGLVCVVIGAIGLIIGFILTPSPPAGSIVSAERHSADLAQMSVALPFVIDGMFLWVIGALILILSSRKKKK